MNHLAKNEETGQTRGQKKRVRRKNEAGKEGDKKSKVSLYTTPPPGRPRPAENMLFIIILNTGGNNSLFLLFYNGILLILGIWEFWGILGISEAAKVR